jgi:hypothetical protein
MTRRGQEPRGAHRRTDGSRYSETWSMPFIQSLKTV